MERLLMAIKLEKMSLEDLRKLQKDVARTIDSYEERVRAEARAKLEQQALEMGYKLSDLVDAGATRKRQKNPPKYRNPENPDMTWTGMGRKPGWVIDALNSGKSLDDLLIR